MHTQPGPRTLTKSNTGGRCHERGRQKIIYEKMLRSAWENVTSRGKSSNTLDLEAKKELADRCASSAYMGMHMLGAAMIYEGFLLGLSNKAAKIMHIYELEDLTFPSGTPICDALITCIAEAFDMGLPNLHPGFDITKSLILSTGPGINAFLYQAARAFDLVISDICYGICQQTVRNEICNADSLVSVKTLQKYIQKHMKDKDYQNPFQFYI